MTDTRYGKSVVERVEASVAELDRKVMEIAAEVRERLVVPLCRRRGFGFLAGNGDYFFHGTKRDESFRYGDSLDDYTPADVRRVLAVLDIEITHGQHIGQPLGRERRAASNEPHPLDVHHCTVPWRSVTGG